MGIVKKYIIIGILGLAMINIGFIGTKVFAIDDPAISTVDFGIEGAYNNTLKLLNISPQTKGWLVNSFCSIVFSDSSVIKVSSVKNSLFDPKQSLFVYILCSNVKPSIKESFVNINEGDKYIKEDALSFLWGGDRLCQGSKSLQSCDLVLHIPVLFDRIINEYFNVKQANIYGIYTPNFEDGEGLNQDLQANMYSLRHFGLLLCDKESKEDGMCKYPKTLRRVKTYQNKAQSLLKNLSIINYEGIFKKYQRYQQSKKAKGVCTIKDRSYDIILCGLFGDETEGLANFTNAVYNELFYYSLFVNYYKEIIGTYPKQFFEQSTLASAIKQANNEKRDWEGYLSDTRNAVKLALMSLREMYFTYPLHVGLLMYQESLFEVRDNLAKIVTPIYTLYDKLRNAQEPAQ